MGKWIWYYGDFEIYHSLKLHARRDEFGQNFPPFWRLDDCWHNVRFRKEVELSAPETITVRAHGVGNVELDGKRHAFGKPLPIPAGKHVIMVHVLNTDGLPCIYVEGETIASDETWLVNAYGREWVNAGSNALYLEKDANPQEFRFSYENLVPVQKSSVNGGVLYDFGRETFAKLLVKLRGLDIDIFYGETKEEALDTKNSYLRAHVSSLAEPNVKKLLREMMQLGQENSQFKEEILPSGQEASQSETEIFPSEPGTSETGRTHSKPGLCDLEPEMIHPDPGVLEPEITEIPARAFRYLYVTGAPEGMYDLCAGYEYLPLKQRGSFRCSDEQINQIWDTAAYTFHLNSREFFLDGIKRDRWVWSGDAYQSYLINRYLFFDADICRRTILALRGKEPVEKHINTIMDYSFYWLMSIYDYYEMTGDAEFVRHIYPNMVSLMDFCLSRLDEHGFASQVGDDWVFVDWADMDKQGAVCAEQMLLARSLEAMAKCSEIIGKPCGAYRKAFDELRENINRFFWDEEKGAFIDSFASGKNNVTRHANIFALLFDYASPAQREKIIENVLQNDAVTQIRTPYFKFHELEAMCRMGNHKEVTQRIRDYWGSMLAAGATTFWEEYTPELPWEEQVGMYGDKYGKSLCHAWGASPIYLLGRYYMGVRPTKPGYETFEVMPNAGGLDWFEGNVPVGGGSVSVRLQPEALEVCADVDGGVLLWNSERYPLKKNEVVRVAR